MLKTDPRDTIPAEVEGVTFRLRVFNQRERARAAVHYEALNRRFAAAKAAEEAGTWAVALDDADIERLEKVLRLGIVGWDETDKLPEYEARSDGYMSDTTLAGIPWEWWGPLYGEINRCLFVTEADAKN